MPQLGSQTPSSTPFTQGLRPNVRMFPPEILALIFEMVLKHYDFEYGQHNYIDRLTEAATIRCASQVCRYWRDVVLDCPRIWGNLINIDFINLAWTEELIKRSKTAPLVVQSAGALDRTLQRFGTLRWQVVFANIKRIQVLHATFSHSDDIIPLMDAVLKPAPLLESCNIVFDPDDGEDAPEMLTSNFTLDLFDGKAPKLQCLTTHEAILPSLRLADLCGLNLRHLDIVFRNTSMPLSLSRWLDILAGQPQLEFLTLSHFLVDRFDVVPSGEDLPKVNLPHLNTLYLVADIVDCGHLFGHLLLPPTAYIHLNLEQNTSEASIQGLSTGLERVFRSWDQYYDSGCFQWRLETDQYAGFNIGIGPADLDGHFFLPQLTIEYNAWQFSPSSHPFPDFLSLFQEVPLINREAILFLGLDFSSNLDGVVSEQTLHPFLSAFKKVSKLILCGTKLDEKLKSILETTPTPPPCSEVQSGDKEDIPPCLFADLSYIAFKICWENEDSLTVFVEFLSWRSLKGRPVPNVILLDDKPEECDESAMNYHAKTVQIVANVDIAAPAPPYCSLCGTC